MPITMALPAEGQENLFEDQLCKIGDERNSLSEAVHEKTNKSSMIGMSSS